MADFQLNGVQIYTDAGHEQRREPQGRTGRATQGNLPDIVGRHRCAGSQRDARCVSRKPHSRVCTTVRRAEGSRRTHPTRRVAAPAHWPLNVQYLPLARLSLGPLRGMARVPLPCQVRVVAVSPPTPSVHAPMAGRKSRIPGCAGNGPGRVLKASPACGRSDLVQSAKASTSSAAARRSSAIFRASAGVRSTP
jgi:hypothetical protein